MDDDSRDSVHDLPNCTSKDTQTLTAQQLGVLDSEIEEEMSIQTGTSTPRRSPTPPLSDIDFNSDSEVFSDVDMFPAQPDVDHFDDVLEERLLEDRNADVNVEVCEPVCADLFSILKARLKGDYKTVIEESAKISRGELLLNCLTFATHFQINFSTFEGMMKLINTMFKTDVMPDTRYKLDVLFKSFSGMHYHFVCINCYNYFGEIDNSVTKSVVCEMCSIVNNICDLSTALFFVMFDIPSQIEVLLSDPVKAKTLKNPFDLVNRQEPRVMRDVFDGDIYQNFIASLSLHENIRHMSICFSVDGAALYSSSNAEIWPLFGCFLELDKKIRMKNLLLCGLWFGSSKPKQDVFLKPFIEEMNRLASDGFKIKVGSENWNMKAHLLGCCADAPARAAVQCVHQHNGSYGCNWCLHPNEHRKYSCLEEVPELRTEEELIQDGAAVLDLEQPNASVNGVVGLSPCIASKTMDAVTGMLLEYFHAAAHGIARQLCGAWLGDDGTDEKVILYYIGRPATVRAIDTALKSIRVPVEARRFPRQISDKEHWKGREFENFFLYYSVPVLMPFLPHNYLKHWILFVQSMHLLIQEEIPERNINIAHCPLAEFLVKTEDLYGRQHMTYNMHIIGSHCAQHAKRWGPLWAINGYGFEDGNKAVKGTIHANKGIASQVCRALCHAKAKDLLQASVGNLATKDFQETLEKKTISKCIFIEDDDKYLGAVTSLSPSQEERWILQHEGIDFTLFSEVQKLVHCGCLYTSASRGRKTDNSVAVLKNGGFVLIQKIIVSQQLLQGFLICKRVLTNPHLLPQGVHPSDAFLRIISVICQESVVCKPSELAIIATRITLAHGDFIVKVPNIINTC